MKKIYEFEVFEEVEVEKEHKTTNDAGEEVITKKKEKQALGRKFFLKQPSRSLTEEAQLFYSSQVAKAQKKGLMPNALIQKRFIEDGGIYTEQEKKEIDDLKQKLLKCQAEFAKLELEKDTEKNKKRREKLDQDFERLSTKLHGLISYERSLFQNSAESFAQERLALYWLAFLCYEVKGEVNLPLFGTDSDSFDERIKYYDNLSESEEKRDEFMQTVVQKFIYLIAVWLNNPSSSVDDYTKTLDLLEKESGDEPEKEPEKESKKKPSKDEKVKT